MNEDKLIRALERHVVSFCPNYDNGNCLPKDSPCQWREGGKYPFSDKGITCPYFRKAVLPADKELEEAYYHHLDVADGKVTQAKADAISSTCARCKVPIIKSSNRQRYCAACSQVRKRKTKARWAREQYAVKTAEE